MSTIQPKCKNGPCLVVKSLVRCVASAICLLSIVSEALNQQPTASHHRRTRHHHHHGIPAIQTQSDSSTLSPFTEKDVVEYSRRSWLERMYSTAFVVTAATATGTSLHPESALAAAGSAPVPDLKFIETSSGIQYADAKLGTGEPITTKGSSITIDYVMSTTGARYGSKIYSTADKNVPYRFKLGDGSTIQGIEMAIAGTADGSIEPMRPGGIRRVIIPANLGYESLARPLTGAGGIQIENCQEGKGIGPIPPVEEGTAGEYYQRFKNIYCNANRPYQPDLVMDIKLYGKR